METIIEEIYVITKEPESLEDVDLWTDWIEIWQGAQDWGQWTDIEYIYEPTTAPPPITSR
jgi:hypothetical protein